MKKTSLLVLLYAICLSCSAAEWRKIVNHSEFEAYVDVSRIRWEGEVAAVWKMMNYRMPQQEASYLYSSGKLRTEHDCAKERQRTTFVIVYADEWGYGEVVTVADRSDTGWKPVIPGSIGEVVHHFVCTWEPFLAPT